MSDIIDISEEVFSNEISSSKTLVLVDFYAQWCGPCKATMPALKDIAEEYADSVKVVKVDIDTEPALAARFGVRGVPTFILMREGEVLEQVSGGQTRSKFAALLEAHIGDA